MKRKYFISNEIGNRSSIYIEDPEREISKEVVQKLNDIAIFGSNTSNTMSYSRWECHREDIDGAILFLNDKGFHRG